MKTSDGNTTYPAAIPTLYRGIQLRSRMEAQCALLFDTLGWNWEYEPESVMLPNGIAYTPDFWLKDFECFIECRGYDSDKGRGQIEGFRGMLKYGDKSSERASKCSSYLNIGPQGSEFLWVYGSRIIADGIICWCHKCQSWAPSWSFLYHCDRCRSSCHFSHGINAVEGKVLIDGLESTQWKSESLNLLNTSFNNGKAAASMVSDLRNTSNDLYWINRLNGIITEPSGK